MGQSPDESTNQPETWVGDTLDGGEAAPAHPSERSAPSGPLIAGRYHDLGPLGSGGMGEVRRVWDTRMARTSAMKIIQSTRSRQARAVDRFVREAHTTGRLQHPGIVPVHDMGQLPDGRWWFTMKEVLGRTFDDALSDLHAATTPAAWPARPGILGFRRLVDALLRVCQTMAYAHAEGFVHRDLKPDNLMLGRFGEVMVLDWGLGKLVDALGEPGLDQGAVDDAAEAMLRHSATIDGGVLGSPPYMPPEQARGDIEELGAPMDVYALGAVLYHLMSGVPPYRGRNARDIVDQVKAGPPRPVRRAALPRCPEPDAELVSVCERSMARDPGARFANAGELARALEDWLDGTRRLEEARAVVAAADAATRELELRGEQVAQLRSEAERLLADIPEDAPEEERHAGWELLERASALLAETQRDEAEIEVSLQSALKLAPSLAQAHERLADLYRLRLCDAEERREPAEIVRNEALLRAHDRGRHAAWLRADGRLSLSTDPPGAAVHAFRFVQRHRQLVPEPLGLLGHTPLREVEIPRGSLLLEVSAPGHETARLPLLVRRGEHVDHVPPGQPEPFVLPLVPTGSMGPDRVYVPAGWALVGGDPLAIDSLPHHRIWVDGFVIGRGHVTVGQYQDFLSDLVSAGRVDEALAAVPSLGSALGSTALWGLGDDGRFRPIGQEIANRPWSDPDLPVTLVTRTAAQAFARWLADRDGLPWRLPHSVEWEKAARGADGRPFPWGDDYVEGRACGTGALRGVPAVQPTGRFPCDCSAHGVLDLAGNVRTWCADAYSKALQHAVGARLVVPPDVAQQARAFTLVRGGCLADSARGMRLACRSAGRDGQSWHYVGFRIVRPYPA